MLKAPRPFRYNLPRTKRRRLDFTDIVQEALTPPEQQFWNLLRPSSPTASRPSATLLSSVAPVSLSSTIDSADSSIMSEPYARPVKRVKLSGAAKAKANRAVNHLDNAVSNTLLEHYVHTVTNKNGEQEWVCDPQNDCKDLEDVYTAIKIAERPNIVNDTGSAGYTTVNDVLKYTQNFYIHPYKVKYEIRNNSTGRCVLTIFKVAPRNYIEDQSESKTPFVSTAWSSTSVKQTPLYLINNPSRQFVYAGTQASWPANYVNRIGVEPTFNPQFKNMYKILQTKRVDLAPGAIVYHEMFVPGVSVSMPNRHKLQNGTLYHASGTAEANGQIAYPFTRLSYFRVEGVVSEVKDSETAFTTTGCQVLVRCTIAKKYSWNGDCAPTTLHGTYLYTSGNSTSAQAVRNTSMQDEEEAPK